MQVYLTDSTHQSFWDNMERKMVVQTCWLNELPSSPIESRPTLIGHCIGAETFTVTIQYATLDIIYTSTIATYTYTVSVAMLLHCLFYFSSCLANSGKARSHISLATSRIFSSFDFTSADAVEYSPLSILANALITSPVIQLQTSKCSPVNNYWKKTPTGRGSLFLSLDHRGAWTKQNKRTVRLSRCKRK